MSLEIFYATMETNIPIERIDQARVQAIGTLVARLHDLLEEYRNPNYLCPNGGHSFECGSILYGALAREMELAGLLAPYPVAPFSGLSFGEIHLKLQHFRSPSWCYPDRYKTAKSHPCNLRGRVTKIAEEAIHPANGLDLKDFGRI